VSKIVLKIITLKFKGFNNFVSIQLPPNLLFLIIICVVLPEKNPACFIQVFQITSKRLKIGKISPDVTSNHDTTE
jgi:hypothetical protein